MFSLTVDQITFHQIKSLSLSLPPIHYKLYPIYTELTQLHVCIIARLSSSYPTAHTQTKFMFNPFLRNCKYAQSANSFVSDSY